MHAALGPATPSSRRPTDKNPMSARPHEPPVFKTQERANAADAYSNGPDFRTSVRNMIRLVPMSGRVSEFGSLGDRAHSRRPASGRVRHVMVTVDDHAHPGLLLEWARDSEGAWVAQVAYLTEDPASLVIAWVAASAVTPIPQADRTITGT